MKSPIITIDGPAGVGKSTVARLLARKLAIPYLDTGAMFRCAALSLGERGIDMTDAELRRLAAKWHFGLGAAGLTFNGEALDSAIRSPEIGALASRLAARPVIREIMLDWQRRMGSCSALVAEGRDMGTVIFPEADYKFFMDAQPEIRAKRRWLEIQASGRDVSLNELTREIRERDERDRSRDIAPLKAAPDAIIVDTSHLDRDQVLAYLLEAININDPGFHGCPDV